MLNGCFVTDHITGSGIDEWMICVANALNCAEDPEVTVPVVFHYGSNPPSSTKQRMFDARLSTRSIRDLRMPDFGMFDFVCCQSPPDQDLVEAVKLCRARENRRIPILGVEHFAKPRSDGRKWQSPADIYSMLCVSLDCVANLPMANRRGRLKIVYNGFDPNKVCSPSMWLPRPTIKKELGIPDEAKVFTFVGSLYKNKRPVETLDGVIELCTRSPNEKFALLFCGDGPERIVLEKKKEKLDKDRLSVHLLNDPDLRKVYHDTNVFIQLSDSEACSFAFNEAVASGCQVVCTYTGFPRRFISHRNPATWPFVYDPDNSQEVADAIENALNGRFSPFLRDIYHELAAFRNAWTNPIKCWFMEVCND